MEAELPAVISKAVARPSGWKRRVIQLNQPSGGPDRYDGNHLGVFAELLVTPEPLTVGLFGLGTMLFGTTQFWIKRDRKQRLGQK